MIGSEKLESVVYRDVASVLIFADGEETCRRSCAAVEEAGFRVSDAVALAEGAERLRRQVTADAVFVHVTEDCGPKLDGLLQAIGVAASSGQRSVVHAPMEMLDRVAARAAHPDIWHLCEASEEEVAQALSEACAPRPQRLNEIDKGHDPLRQLSDEVVRISEMLARLSEQGGPEEPASKGAVKEQPVTAASIRAMIRARRMRDQHFPEGMFADPAWDMLLDLMAARLEGQRVAVSSLCIAAAVPPTTALRWIKTLTDHGFFVRVADQHDGRRVFIELSDDAAERVEKCLRGGSSG